MATTWKVVSPNGIEIGGFASERDAMPGTYAGHEKARRALGLPPSPEWQDRARRFKAQPLTKHERFAGAYADAWVA